MADDITYDVTVTMPRRDAPGMQRITDLVFDSIAKATDTDERTLGVIVKGPPELSIGMVRR